MLAPTTQKEISKIGLDDILDFMAGRPEGEKLAFKTFATSEINDVDKDGNPYTRKPCFFEIRNWVVDRYFPDCAKKQVKVTMYDKISSL